MPYLILVLFFSVLLAIALHLRNQFRQTAHIRQSLKDARANKILNGVHNLRAEK